MKVARMSCTLYALSHLQSLTKMLQKIYIVNMKFMVIWALGARPRVRISGTSFVQGHGRPAFCTALYQSSLLLSGSITTVCYALWVGPMLTGLVAQEPQVNTSISVTQLRGVWPARAQVVLRRRRLQFGTETAGRGVLRGLQAGSCSRVPGLWSWSHKEAS